MESANLIFTLIIAGIMAGSVNFLVSYLDLPFIKNSSPLTDNDWPKPKSLWLAILGYYGWGVFNASS